MKYIRNSGTPDYRQYLRESAAFDSTRRIARERFERDQRPLLREWYARPLWLRLVLTLCGMKPRDWYSISGCQGIGGCRYEVWDRHHRLVRVDWQYSELERVALRLEQGR